MTVPQGGGHGAPLWYFCCVGLHAETYHCSVLKSSLLLTDCTVGGRQAGKQARVFAAAAEHNEPFLLGLHGCSPSATG